MSTFIVIIMVLLLIVALERQNRRQSPHAPGLHGSPNHDDRDWARIKLELLALDDKRHSPANHHSGPRPAWHPAQPGVVARPEPWASGHRRDCL